MKIIILVIAAMFVFAGGLYAENGNITKKPEEFVPKVADFEKIKIGVTKEKDIIALFGEPHMVFDDGVIRENKPGVSWDWKGHIEHLHIVPPLKPNQKLFGYIFPYWAREEIILFIIINKNKKLVEWFHRRAIGSIVSEDFGGGEYHNF